jgi:hypothetical protein
MNEHAPPVTTAIWSFQRRLTHRLALWASATMAGGLLLARRPHPSTRAFGRQSAAWGLINACIALGGQYAAERAQARATPARERAQARWLRRLLWLNAGLDVFYILGGLWAARQPAARRRGHGAAVIVQGLALFIFDTYHAQKVPAIESGKHSEVQHAAV